MPILDRSLELVMVPEPTLGDPLPGCGLLFLLSGGCEKMLLPWCECAWE